MSATPWSAGARAVWRKRLRRPEGIVASTRWLFAGLPLIIVLVSLPVPLVNAHGDARLLAFASCAAAVLAGSCLYTYFHQRALFGLDVLDAAAIGGFAMVCPDPATVFGVVFACLWYRALYGTTFRSVVRCGLYVAGMAISWQLWTLIPGHSGTPAAGQLLSTYPIMFLMVIIARQLASSLLAREQGLRRDAALTATGSQLLGVTDAVAIRAMAWDTLTEICTATAGLRVLKAVREGELLRIDQSAGEFTAVPATVDGYAISDGRPTNAHVIDASPFDAAVGAPMQWVCISLSEQNEDAWLVIGTPKKISAEAMLALRSLVNQVTLALRNSDVHKELTMQARVDALTGLANRAAFTAELSRTVASLGSASTSQVLFLDLDDFKDVNDVLGHRAGDDLLLEVANRLRRCTRPDDVCARLGGDEFAVVLRGASEETAVDIASRMVESIAEPIELNGQTAHVGASIGIAIGTPLMQMEELVHQADVAMYAAKACGKGRIQVFNPGLLQADTYRVSFESQLARATAAGELVVHYQPILSMPDFRCIAIEALVRWKHPQQGLLEPERFIEIAERTGAIHTIGAFVLEHACAEAATWTGSGAALPVVLHVNVSAKQLDDDQFVELVRRCLAKYGIPASRLVLEITETVGLNSPAAILRLNALAACGIGIAIDDFGTGYSSLTTLRSLPVSVIKLDRTFIAGALANPVDRTVIEAIVHMSSQLGLLTIAEGIERPDQQHFLEQIGCHAVQGYLYLRPVPTVEIASWLDDNLSGRVIAANSIAVPLTA